MAVGGGGNAPCVVAGEVSRALVVAGGVCVLRRMTSSPWSCRVESNRNESYGESVIESVIVGGESCRVGYGSDRIESHQKPNRGRVESGLSSRTESR